MIRHRSPRVAAVAAALLLASLAPAAGASLSVTDSAGMPGSQVTVSLVLDNDTPVRGLQLVLTDTPDRLRLVDARRTARTQALELDLEERTDGSIPIVLISFSGATISPGDGAIVDFDLSLDTDTTPGDSIGLGLSDVRVADAAGMPVTTTTAGGSVLIQGPSGSPTMTPTDTPTKTPIPTFTSEPTLTPTPSHTSSPTLTPEPSITPTHSATPTDSTTPSVTVTPTPTPTPTLTLTPTSTTSAAATPTPTLPPTATVSASETPTGTPTLTDTSTATPLPTDTPTVKPSCPGDCDGDGSVVVDELLVLVNISLSTAPVTACSSADVDADGTITVDEILIAVNNALNGC